MDRAQPGSIHATFLTCAPQSSSSLSGPRIHLLGETSRENEIGERDGEENVRNRDVVFYGSGNFGVIIKRSFESQGMRESRVFWSRSLL